ncbi:MAG: SMP-30/gluconolactonase/LRE family protein [Ktedonobacterales bacterium]
MWKSTTRSRGSALAFAVGAVVFLVLAACAGSPSMPVQATHATSTATATEAVPTATATFGPAHYMQVTLAHGFGSPDDLALDAQGRIVFADSVNGGVYRVEANGQVTRLIGGLSAPEGVLPLPDGSLLITVQGFPGATRDEIVRLAPGASSVTLFASFPNTTGSVGLDSISRDAATGAILAADSPNGVVYRLSPDGRQRTLVASGFTRPVDAITDGVGNIYVADEYGFTVVKIAVDGTRTTLAHMSYPDDLAFDVDGSLLVTELGHNTLERIDPATGRSLGTVATNLLEPQGLAVDARGNLYIAEERGNVIVELRRE